MTDPAAGEEASPTLRWQNVDRVAAGVIALAVAILLREAMRLRFGELSTPGPGFWPTSISVVTLALCVLVLFVGRDTPESVNREQLRRVCTFIAIVVAFVPLYDRLGFILAAFLVMVGLLRVVGKERWVASVATAAVASLAIYGVFAVALELSLRPFI